MKQLIIDPDKIMEYLIDNCAFIVHSDKGTRHCRIKQGKACNIPLYLRDSCPSDCPKRLVETTQCDGDKCKMIKNKFKSLLMR